MCSSYTSGGTTGCPISTRSRPETPLTSAFLLVFAFALGFGTTVAEPALIAVAKEAAQVAIDAILGYLKGSIAITLVRMVLYDQAAYQVHSDYLNTVRV